MNRMNGLILSELFSEQIRRNTISFYVTDRWRFPIMKRNDFNGRKTEILKMLNNEFIERKSILIKELEMTKQADIYLKNLAYEEREIGFITEAIKKYFEGDKI